MTLEITYYFPNKDDQSKFIGEFGIRIVEWDMYLSKLKLIRTLNGNYFVAAPSSDYTDKEGKKQYKPYWTFGKEKSQKFFDSALKAVQEHIEKKYGST